MCQDIHAFNLQGIKQYQTKLLKRRLDSLYGLLSTLSKSSLIIIQNQAPNESSTLWLIIKTFSLTFDYFLPLLFARMSNATSHSSDPQPGPSTTDLAANIANFKTQIASPVRVASQSTADKEPGSSVPEQPSARKACRTGALQFTISVLSSNVIGKVLTTREAHQDIGKLNFFKKLTNLPPHPSSRFISKPEGLFGRIKSSNLRDDWKAGVLWNIGKNTENALVALHKVAKQLKAEDSSSAPDYLSIVHLQIQASYHRISNHFDFFTNSIDLGMSKTILL